MILPELSVLVCCTRDGTGVAASSLIYSNWRGTTLPGATDRSTPTWQFRLSSTMLSGEPGPLRLELLGRVAVQCECFNFHVQCNAVIIMIDPPSQHTTRCVRVWSSIARITRLAL